MSKDIDKEASEAFKALPKKRQVEELLLIAELMLSVASVSSHEETWNPAVTEWLEHLDSYRAGKHA